MEVIAENHSMYPRVGESDHLLRLRRAHHRYDQGEIDEQELRTIIDSYVEELIQEQIDAGLDVVTDGMVRWYDHVSHLARGLEGTEVAGLVRFFDTNYLVREARVVDRVRWTEPILRRDHEFAREVSEQPVKAILTGPYTMAAHSILEEGPYDRTEELAQDYAEALRDEVEALAEGGLEHLQVEEPSLLQNPSAASTVLPLLDRVIEPAAGARTRLATYFGDAAPLYDALQGTAFDTLVFDFTYSEGLEPTIRRQGSDKDLGLGILNGRNTRLEETDPTVRTARRILEDLPDGTHSVTFSCSLDYLPRDRARRKLRRLSRIRDGVLEGAVQS